MTTFLQSLNQALHGVCQRDPDVYVIGEDLLDPYGGAFKVTRGLSSKFPERVLTTPISEAAIVGLGAGMALRGLKPVVEIMFGDFIGLCFDQLYNHASKYRAMYGDQVTVPLVVRTAVGAGRGYGPTHSQSPEKHLFGIPNLKVVAPTLFHDPGALLETAISDPDPVVFIEHKLLYPAQLLTPQEAQDGLHVTWDGDEHYPTARVANFEVGHADVVLLTYGGCSRHLEGLLRRLAADEIRVVCLLPSLLNAPAVELFAAAACAAAGGCLVWEESARGFDWGSEVIAQLHQELGPGLGRVRRLASWPTIIPAARPLEDLVLPGPDSAEKAIIDLLTESMH